ncbi:hypothetical protein [Streptomyces sp. NPDC001851]|uniref:hypothetical protein n=1 Tax=Streptomyces sp. NPDC001851 TaxID=3154529 RepID=UPI00331DEE3E
MSQNSGHRRGGRSAWCSPARRSAVGGLLAGAFANSTLCNSASLAYRQRVCPPDC